MAELTIEQKAKAYDEALERMKSWVRGEHPECFDSAKKAAEFIFPVLKNEDERIKKWLYNIIKNGSYLGEIPFDKNLVLAWIEKQGEVKTANNEFKVGDWVVINDCKIGRITECTTEFATVDCETSCFLVRISNIRPWTIQDAKDGDVLVSESTCGLGAWYCIFKSLDGDESMTVYCYLARDGMFETKKELCFDKDPYNTNPATKEQCDLLFQKMKQSGYEWDAEKKELKKIEPKFKVGDIVKRKDNPHLTYILKRFTDDGDYEFHAIGRGGGGGCIRYSDVKFQDDWELVEHKVEPKFRVGDIMRTLKEAANGWIDGMPVVVSIDEENYRCNNETIAIKDQDDYEYPPMNRGQKSAWSNEDELQARQIERIVHNGCTPKLQKKIADWFLSIKDRMQKQSTWKPTDEMLEALYKALPKNVMEISEDEMLLDKLYQGLKYGRVLSEN